ncbi:glycosyl hydrolase-related protein [Tardisphaera saccharovorans]
MGEPPYQEAEAFTAPLLAIPAGGKVLPSSSGSFVSLPQEAVLTSLKPSEDGRGIVIRVYNPTERPIERPMSFAFPVERVLLSLMDERDGEEVPVKHVNEDIPGYLIRLPPGSVETFKVLLANASDRPG